MDFQKLKSTLENKGYKVSTFKTKEDVITYLDNEIDNTSIGFGGSMTIKELGLYEKLGAHNSVYYHGIIPDGKTKAELLREASLTKVYMSSVNGLAETGEIINIDGVCNRIASILFGHEKVYLIVGKNKIAPDYDKALWRAQNIAAPLNAKRLNKKTPCAVKADKCYNCNSPDRICCGVSVHLKAPMTGETEIVLVDENLGY